MRQRHMRNVFVGSRFALEPERPGRGFGIKSNWPGLVMVAIGGAFLLAAAELFGLDLELSIGRKDLRAGLGGALFGPDAGLGMGCSRSLFADQQVTERDEKREQSAAHRQPTFFRFLRIALPMWSGLIGSMTLE